MIEHSELYRSLYNYYNSGYYDDYTIDFENILEDENYEPVKDGHIKNSSIC